jgi:integrase
MRLKGINQISKRLADGSRVTYYYAWKGGPRLQGEPGSPEFIASYNAALGSRKTVNTATLHKLIAEFKGSAEFATLGEKTKKDYARYIGLIEDEFGSMPIEALADPEVRGEFKAWRDRFSDTPRKADLAWTVLARILSVAKDRGRISVNPCERGGRLYEADRSENVWNAEHIKQFCAAASAEIQMAMLLALWTGQRQGDLLRLTWNNYDGRAIRLRQSKSGKRVTIPAGEPLRLALERERIRRREADARRHQRNPKAQVAVTLLVNTRGRPWTEDGFRTSWGDAFDTSKIKDDLHFHDLRGTAVTRLALAGCTVPEIAAITGHSLKDVEAILDAHYLGGRVELAEAAVMKLNAAFGVVDGTTGEQKFPTISQPRLR